VNRLTITHLPLAGLKRIERQRIGDARGSLARLFCAEELGEAGWRKPVAQINHSVTVRRGTVRGLHFQAPPFAEMKLVSCLRGEVWDVAVDIRAGSKTFLHWHAETLSVENGYALLIPHCFAHGFQALSDDAELLYCHSAPYNAAAEGALNAKDPRLAITWPIEITALSPRDTQHPMLTDAFAGVAP
jgi:dTDP-4-dehydrorhamnose 3,5-epimerase